MNIFCKSFPFGSLHLQPVQQARGYKPVPVIFISLLFNTASRENSTAELSDFSINTDHDVSINEHNAFMCVRAQ